MMDSNDAIKVMVVGDSISHGCEGDFTWRYRLWEWFKDNNIAVEFVGPYTGTNPPPDVEPPPPDLKEPEPRTSGGYALGIPDFDSKHFSVWGRQAAQDKALINEMVLKYDPDYLLVELGFNDMGWFVSGPEDTLKSMEGFIHNARLAKPDLSFAIANVPHRTYIPGRDDLPVMTDEYNKLLVEAIPRWNRSYSRVELVHFRENYECELDACPAGYDGLHPNALGEYQIAQAFSRVLFEKFNIGGNVLTVPAQIPPRPVSTPTHLEAISGPLGIIASWDAVYGVYCYELRVRVQGTSHWTYHRTNSTRFAMLCTTAGRDWECQVRGDCGEENKSEWSSTVLASVQSDEESSPDGPGPHNEYLHPGHQAWFSG